MPLNRNHMPQNENLVGKIGIFTFIAGVLYWLFSALGTDGQKWTEVIKETTKILTEEKNTTNPAPTTHPSHRTSPPKTSTKTTFSTDFLPTSTTGEVVQHQYYTLSYSEKHEQAEWCAYQLTKKHLDDKWAERAKSFTPDPDVPTGSAMPRDYTNSGYDRGHLVPAGDMAFSDEAMIETFYMSNISPQESGFNRGIWKELEANVRDWGKKYGELYVITGPILSRRAKGHIGAEGKITVPSAYYKILLDVTASEPRAVAFAIPNAISDAPIANFIVTIRDIEDMTGIDFFPNLYDAATAERIETVVNKEFWKFDRQKFDLRIQKWNLNLQ
jgi:endonuclease G, mitochondrial